MVCNTKWVVELPYDNSVFRMKWDMWAGGDLIQRVFPELTTAQREGLQTGTCSKCWAKIFPPEKL